MNQQPQIYFAPLQGITTQTFRSVFAKYFIGVDKLFTPYFTKIMPGVGLDSKKLIALKNQFESGIEVIPQILSNNADEIIWFANNCKQMGFSELNWNLGCPHPQVTNKKLGSGLLPFPEIVNEILHKVMSEINIPFSIKCRLGYYSANEFTEIIPIFNRYHIHELTIHARIGRQLYSGQTDIETFAHFAPQLNSPLVYNGDIFCKDDFLRFKMRFPEINRLMIGRGILTDPFLPSRIKGFDLPSDPKAQLRLFIDDLYYAYRKDKNNQLSLLSAMKEYWTYLSKAFDEPVKVFRKLKKCNRFDIYEDAVNKVFAEHDLLDTT